MGNDRDEGTAGEESSTDVEQLAHGHVEFAPIRHGMVLAERWTVDQILGRGGMGVVVRAHDRALGVTVAVKIVRAEFAGERSWAERLAREVKLARQIHHPNVCRVFELGQDAGRVFLVMELAERGTLRDELRARATYAERPLADRLADARAVAAGLAAIHAAGIVHRDVSPQNLLRMSDGRLVVSDFGLATDAAETTTSIHGGTLAYMAPELVRGGGRASVASDVWALGVVIHEIVFGEKPTWREPAGSEMLPPSPGRPMAALDDAAFEVCRACTATEPARRVRTPGEVERMLGEGTKPTLRSRAHVSQRRLLAIAASAIVVSAAVGAIALNARRSQPADAVPSTERSPLIVATGEPADWTKKSAVLAEVPDRVHCTSLLPDRRTIRFVWGFPRRAEDVDTQTGRRFPSPLVPEAYAEGCPDVAPDGKRMVFAGHTPDKRPFAFVSERTDGSQAIAVVQIAEPTMNSDPTWMADGKSFSYEADMKHMGAFWLTTNRAIVLPQATARDFLSTYHHVVRDEVFILAVDHDFQAEVLGLAWPSLQERVRFRYANPILDVASQDGRTYYCSTPSLEDATPLLAITPAERRGRRAGLVREQYIRYPRFVAGGLTFASLQAKNDLYLRSLDQRWHRVTNDGWTLRAVSCGKDVLVSRAVGHRQVIARLERSTGTLTPISDGPTDSYPACAADGKVAFYVKGDTGSRIQRCDAAGCRPISDIAVLELAVSPDGDKLAFVTNGGRGPMIRWMSALGGPAHDVTDTETGCRPGWSSNRTLWVSRRNGKGFLWTEVEVDSGRPTGKSVPGSRDCTDGWGDPLSPVDPDVRVRTERRSQLRFLPSRYLDSPSGLR